jgi:hypothetical protein
MTSAALPIPINNWQLVLKVLSLLGRHTAWLRRRALVIVAAGDETRQSNHADFDSCRPLLRCFEDFEREVLVTKQSAEALQAFLIRGIER